MNHLFDGPSPSTRRISPRGCGFARFLSLVGLLATEASCGGGGGGGGGPSGLADEPTVTSITPSSVQPGDQVSIFGDNFGTSTAQVSVTFNGVSAVVVSVSDELITATVPPIAPGNATVVVTVAGRTAGSSTLAVLRAVPVITGLIPSSVRAGGRLTITGRNLLALSRLALGGAAVEVLLNDRVLTPISATQVVVDIPLDTPPGNYTLTGRREGDVSNALTVRIEIFTVTGTYFFEGVITSSDCPAEIFEFPQGTDVVSIGTVFDNRPTVTVVLRAPDAQGEGLSRSGTLMSDGSFQASLVGGGESLTLTGRFALGPNDVAFVEATDIFELAVCRVRI